jgi:Ulp1 protease family, C-terminal catalytic domain
MPNRELIRVASPRPPARFVPLYQNQVTVHLHVNGAWINSMQEVADYLNTLNPDQVVNTIRGIQDQIQDNSEYLQDVASSLWQLMQTRQDLRERRARNIEAFENEFQVILNGHNQSTLRRNRIAEAQRRLTASWMTPIFFETVVLNQTNGSSAVLDALYAARTYGLPGRVIQRASDFRLQRLARIGPYSRYGTTDLTITPQDIKNAADNSNPTPASEAHENEAARINGLIADRRGIHWLGGVPPPGIEAAYVNAGELTAPPEFPTGTLPSNTGADSPRSDAVTPTIQPSIETDPSRPNLRPQQNRISYEGMQGINTSKRHRNAASPSPPPRRHPVWIELENGSPGPKPVDIIDLISGLQTLTVSPSQSPVNPKRVKAIKNPVLRPSQLDKALWSHAMNKAQAIAEQRQPPQLSDHQRAQLAESVNSLPNLHASIQRLSSGLRETLGGDEDNLRAYLEGLCDCSSMAYTAYNQDRYTINGVRDIAGRLHRAFDGAAAQIGNGNENQQGITVQPSDFDTLIRDEMHSGWLNSIVLMAALLGIARDRSHQQTTFVVHIDHMLLYRTGQTTVNNLPLPDRAMNLVIPLHWGNHWTVGLVDVETRTIHHMDSMHQATRHQAGLSIIQQLLRQREDLFSHEDWTIGTMRSGQQSNSDDCGLWVIENARRLMEGTDHIAPVGAATRRFITEELYGHLITDTPPLTQQSRREAEVSRVRQVAENASGPGRSFTSPLHISAPGPDMPYLPTSQPQGSRQSTSSLSPARTDITDPFRRGIPNSPSGTSGGQQSSIRGGLQGSARGRQRGSARGGQRGSR